MTAEGRHHFRSEASTWKAYAIAVERLLSATRADLAGIVGES
jgi:hypothetical protein